ncbi:cerberus-like [Huso huso]|uniref:Cerberus-like n=1 Tax=Huso huso TaxID=61971 RepID=A0ABR1AAF8_HUSHU
MNQTQKNNNDDSRHAFARIPLSGSRPQELNLDVGPGRGMRETMNHATITNILAGARSTPTDSFNRPPHPPPFKQAKQFWNHFVRRRSDSQEAIVPIKTTEVQQQTCKALPFLQSVVHENCEKVVLKNSLCFGRCSSIHVPRNEDHTKTICSYCIPTKFTRKTVELKCKGSISVTKLVMLVEECQCEAQKGWPPQLGPFLLDPSLGIFTNQA